MRWPMPRVRSACGSGRVSESPGSSSSPRRDVHRVLTDAGPIDTEIVVNAAGMWAPQVAAMVGGFVPSTPVDHQHIALQAGPGP